MYRPTDRQLAEWHGAVQPNISPSQARAMCFELLQRRLQEERIITLAATLRRANEDPRLDMAIDQLDEMLGIAAKDPEWEVDL